MPHLLNVNYKPMINFSPNSSDKLELDALVVTAELIIHKLLDIIKEQLPNFYSSSDEVLCGNDWLKWVNGEAMDSEVETIVQEIKDFCG